MNQDPSFVAARKTRLRGPLIADRKQRTGPDRAIAAAANTAHLLDVLVGADTVCGYLPLASEPLSDGLLDALVDRGVTVLVPVVRPDAALDWCRYPGPTETVGPGGIAEPTGTRLGPEAVRDADVVLVPSLSVDRCGRRLGRGGGHYDRTLALLECDHRADLIAVLFDGELIDSLPTDDHDQRVTSAVTPSGGWRRLPS